jgi:hypothetical protein
MQENQNSGSRCDESEFCRSLQVSTISIYKFYTWALVIDLLAKLSFKTCLKISNLL